MWVWGVRAPCIIRLTLLTLVITNLCNRAFLSLVSLACLAFYLFYWFLRVLNRKRGFKKKHPQKKRNPTLCLFLRGGGLLEGSWLAEGEDSILMLIQALDKEQSSRANNGSGARKSALQSSTPWKACQAGRLGLPGGAAGGALPPAAWAGGRPALGKSHYLQNKSQGWRPSAPAREAALVSAFFALKKANPQTPFWVVSARLLPFRPFVPKIWNSSGVS